MIVVHGTLDVLNPGVEPYETKNPILQDGSAEGEAGKYAAEMVFFGDILLELRIGQAPARGGLTRERVIPRNCRELVGIQRIILKISKHRTVILVRAFLHDDVNYAAQRPTVLRLDSGVLDFHFLHKIERHVGVRVAADQVGCFLPFHKVGVL